MKHSLFDKIFLGFLVLSIASFALLVFYSTYATKDALADEKKATLSNEASLIVEQTMGQYVNHMLTIEQVEEQLIYYSNTLHVSVWLVDVKGKIIASSNQPEVVKMPVNIFSLDSDFDLTENQSFTGNFYDCFKADTISVAIPITVDKKPNGMVVLHATTDQLKAVQSDVVQAIYIPFLMMLVISFALLGIISGKIMMPIKKINAVAEEYSTGNFDTKINIKSDDDIGKLAATLEYMASELSKLDEYRKAFISNISHDFRSPLTSIKGYIEAIQDGTIPPEKQDKYLGIVIDETKRLTKLTSSLLELNNYDTYGLWLIFKDFDVIELIKKAMNTYEGKCQEREISLILNNHCENTKVHADSVKIQQVIYNLLDNAIKFTPRGKSIYFTLTEKNDKIFISVKDEGAGIPEEALKKIWVRFYKADASRGKDKQGTGLGLSITREIIKAHNENINVVSTEGVGSEFTFSLSKAEETDTL